VVEAVYLGFVIGNLVLIAAFRFQVSPFSVSAFSLQPSVFSLQPSAFSLQPSAFSLQPSAFSLQPSAFSLQPSVFCPLVFAVPFPLSAFGFQLFSMAPTRRPTPPPPHFSSSSPCPTHRRKGRREKATIH
jgi:hypothetical protein